MTTKPQLIVVGNTDAPVCEDGVCAVPENAVPQNAVVEPGQ